MSEESVRCRKDESLSGFQVVREFVANAGMHRRSVFLQLW